MTLTLSVEMRLMQVNWINNGCLKPVFTDYFTNECEFSKFMLMGFFKCVCVGHILFHKVSKVMFTLSLMLPTHKRMIPSLFLTVRHKA